MLRRSTLVLTLALFLTVIWLASGQSAWVGFAQGTVPPVPPAPIPPGPPGGESFGEPYGPVAFRYVVPGKAAFGKTTMIFAPELFPTADAYILVTWDYDTAAVPFGSLGGGFRAPGDNRIGLFVTDQSGQLVRSFPPPGFNLCFTVNAGALEQTPEAGRVVEWWSGSKWVPLDTTIAGPTDGAYQMCASVLKY